LKRDDDAGPDLGINANPAAIGAALSKPDRPDFRRSTTRASQGSHLVASRPEARIEKVLNAPPDIPRLAADDIEPPDPSRSDSHWQGIECPYAILAYLRRCRVQHRKDHLGISFIHAPFPGSNTAASMEPSARVTKCESDVPTPQTVPKRGHRHVAIVRPVESSFQKVHRHRVILETVP
jgi:hypothetical protein